MSNSKNLFDEFSPVSKEEWLEKVQKDLKGRPIEDLQWALGEDLKIDPFYHSEDNIEGTFLNSGLSADNDWQIGENFYITNPIEDNIKLLSALENGVNAPQFIFAQVPTQESIGLLFDKIIPNYIHTFFKIEGEASDYSLFLENYYNYLQSQNIDSSELTGSIDLSSNQSGFIPTLKMADKLFPNFKSINLDFRHHDNDKSQVVDQLMEMIQQIDQLFQKLESNQVGSIRVSINLGTSYFLEIAKLRAIKILWSNLLNAYQTPPLPLPIDAYINPKAYDKNANTNMIRSMTIAMSAVIGGVSRLTILPVENENAGFSNRIARNVQHLLKMESYLDRVIDPSTGSFYIEKLTRLFAEKAWEKFIQTGS